MDSIFSQAAREIAAEVNISRQRERAIEQGRAMIATAARGLLRLMDRSDVANIMGEGLRLAEAGGPPPMAPPSGSTLPTEQTGTSEVGSSISEGLSWAFPGVGAAASATGEALEGGWNFSNDESDMEPSYDAASIELID